MEISDLSQRLEKLEGRFPKNARVSTAEGHVHKPAAGGTHTRLHIISDPLDHSGAITSAQHGILAGSGGTHTSLFDIAANERITLRNAPSATQGHIEFTGSQIKLNTSAAVIYDSGGSARIRVGQTGAGNAYTSIIHSSATLGNLNAVLYIARGDTTGSDVAGIEAAINPTLNASVNNIRLLDMTGTLTATGFAATNTFGLRFAASFTGGTWTNATVIAANPLTSGSPQFGTLRFFWADRPAFGWAVAAGSTTVIGMDLEGLGLANFANAIGIRLGLSSLASSVNVGIFLDNAVTPGLPSLTGNYSILSVNTADSVLAGKLLIGANAAPATSAVLELQSTTGALLLSRMTTAQRDALTAVDGMALYNSDAAVARVQVRENASWESLAVEKQTEIDFGATPVDNASFTVTDAAVTTGSRITATVAYEAPTGKDLDEVEMDQLELLCGPGAGQFTLFARGMEGYVADKFKINYVVA